MAVDPDEADGAGPHPAGGRTRRVPLEQLGTDPDYRFSLANERTFLAWIRTSLALVAAGVALVQFGPALGPRPIRLALGILLIVTAAALAATSHWRWESNERAMRLGRPLPRNRATAVLGYALAVVAVVMLVVVLVKG